MIEEFKNRPREEAREQIEDYIAVHGLKGYDRLPSERDLCTMWGYNRMTLRSAIQNLIMEGVLYNKKGSGTYVAPQKLNRNLQDLKSFSATVQETGRTLTTKVVSKRIIECNKQVSQKLCLTLGHQVFELIRIRNIDDEPILIETTYLDYEKHAGIDTHDFGSESLYAVLETNYGTIVSSGSEKVGITYATTEEAKLLAVGEGTPVFFLTGVVSDCENRPVEYFKTIARSDKMRFSSTLKR